MRGLATRYGVGAPWSRALPAEASGPCRFDRRQCSRCPSGRSPSRQRPSARRPSGQRRYTRRRAGWRHFQRRRLIEDAPGLGHVMPAERLPRLLQRVHHGDAALVGLMQLEHAGLGAFQRLLRLAGPVAPQRLLGGADVAFGVAFSPTDGAGRRGAIWSGCPRGRCCWRGSMPARRRLRRANGRGGRPPPSCRHCAGRHVASGASGATCLHCSAGIAHAGVVGHSRLADGRVRARRDGRAAGSGVSRAAAVWAKAGAARARPSTAADVNSVLRMG